jgi:hypothetical protein
MATYEEIQDWVRNQYGFSVKTCWIAHAKETCGLKPRLAPNRYNPKIRTNPCPPEKLDSIKNAFRFF